MLQWFSPWSLLTLMDWDMLTSVWVFCGGCRISLLRWFVCRRLAHFLRMSFLRGFRGLVICVLVLLVLLVLVSLQSCIVLCFSWSWRLPPSLYWLYLIPTLLCGDFNTVPARSCCRRSWFLSVNLTPLVRVPFCCLLFFRDCCVVDIWRLKHPDVPGFTWSRRDEFLASRVDLSWGVYVLLPLFCFFCRRTAASIALVFFSCLVGWGEVSFVRVQL